MYEDVPTAYINIYKGGVYSESWNLGDETGAALTAAGGWTGRAELRTTYGGTLVATFAASGGDGTVTFDDQGNVTLTLPSSFTTTMTATVTDSGPKPVYVGDLEVWQTSDTATRYKALLFRVRVFPEVTTS